jgi:hypothetical protein
VPVLDLGVTQSGMLYLVMELVAGSSLAAARARYGDQRWVLLVLFQIAEALVAMHARGIIHRDLKPSNILLDGDRVKVADFGLAGLTDSALVGEADTIDPDSPLANSPDLTRTGAILGTPLYMAPELAGGARAAGPTADVFSLGVVAYELFSSQAPFAASNVRGALPILRANGFIPIFLSVIYLPIIRASFPATWSRVAVSDLIIIVVNATAILYSYRASLRWIRPAVVCLALLNGGANVAVNIWLLHVPKQPGDVSSAAIVHVVLVATLLRLGPALTIVTTIPVVAFAEIFYVREFLARHIDAQLLATISSAMGVIVVVGILISAAIDRSWRRSYRRERIIESQRAEIDRLERAELRRQVAERARRLSEALARPNEA